MTDEVTPPSLVLEASALILGIGRRKWRYAKIFGRVRILGPQHRHPPQHSTDPQLPNSPKTAVG